MPSISTLPDIAIAVYSYCCYRGRVQLSISVRYAPREQCYKGGEGSLAQIRQPICAPQRASSGDARHRKPCQCRTDYHCHRRLRTARQGELYAFDYDVHAVTEPRSLKSYAAYAVNEPSKCKIVAIAEPRPRTRKNFARMHLVDDTLVFNTWQDLCKASAETINTVGKRLADAVVVAVQDHMHLEVVLAFAEQGYHILCEKPMSTNLEDCLKMEAVVKKQGLIFGMGHGMYNGRCVVPILMFSSVLRYSPYNLAMTDVIRSGALGELINVVHIEPVGYYHFAHSYVRGSWSKESDSCFSLMTKSCQ